MPRLHTVTIKQLYASRAKEFERHYNNHRTVQETFSIYDHASVCRVLQREIPPPVMRTDGSLIDGIPTIRGRAYAAHLLNIDPMQKELMCIWYWSPEGWEDFNKQYKSLPDVFEDHYYRYDEERDIVDLVPLSEKKSEKRKVQVGYKWTTCTENSRKFSTCAISSGRCTENGQDVPHLYRRCTTLVPDEIPL